MLIAELLIPRSTSNGPLPRLLVPGRNRTPAYLYIYFMAHSPVHMMLISSVVPHYLDTLTARCHMLPPTIRGTVLSPSKARSLSPRRGRDKERIKIDEATGVTTYTDVIMRSVMPVVHRRSHKR